MLRRLLWTLPAVLMGGLVGISSWLIMSICVSLSTGMSMPSDILGQIALMAVCFLGPCWILLVIPTAFIFKETSPIYSFRIAPWLGACLGLVGYLLAMASLGVIRFREGPGSDSTIKALAIVAFVPALTGAAIATTLAFLRHRFLSETDSAEPPLPPGLP